MTGYYDEFERATITRQGRNGIPYTIQHEQRYVPSNVDRPRTGSRGYQDNSEQENDDANKQNQRRRIPIACGRCRKRKIRCSGQQGDQACQNCKTAGNENCHFNRVQAQELYFADHSYNNNNNMALGTLPIHLPGRNSATPFCEVPTAYPMVPLSSNGRVSFRHAALDYPRPGTYGGQYGEYPDDIGYGGMTYPPPPMHHEPLDVGFGSGNIPPPPRTFTPGPLIHKPQNIGFYEPAGSYPQQGQQAQTQQLGHYGGPGQSFAPPLRSSISSPDSHNAWGFQGMAQTLPNPSERPHPTLPAPLPSSRPAPRYDPQMIYGGTTVPSNASTASLLPTLPMKTLNTSSNLANDSWSPDGTITSNSSFNSADTASSQSDIYESSNEWSGGGIQDSSATHSSIPQQQHHLPSQSQAQMTSMALSTRRSHNDLQNELASFDHNASAHNSNGTHPYSLNNGSLTSLHTGSALNLNSSHNLGSNVQGAGSGSTTPQASSAQHPQVRKSSHHHPAPFPPMPSSGDTSLPSGLGSSSISTSLGTTGYPNASLSVNGHLSGDGVRASGISLLSDEQHYEPWIATRTQQAQSQSLGRGLEHRGSLHGMSVVRVE